MEPGWGDDDELAPAVRRNPLTAVVAVLLVIALVGAGVVIAFDRTTSDDDRTSFERPSVTAPVGPPPTADQLDAVVAELSAFVSAARELPFRDPVDATLLPDAEFAARVREDAIDDLEGLDETERVLRAVGLLEDEDDLAAVLTAFLGDGVVGFYDPETGELVLRGAALTPYVRTTLVHELTHALDDQHFGLDREEYDEADDERGYAFSALVEGNAVRVEEEYRATLSEDELDQADAEEARLGAGLDFSRIPRILPELIGFPYAFGPALVDALVERGGEGRVNEAFAAPPTTTEQVLDPTGWLAGDADPVEVAPPTSDGEAFDQGVLGLWGIVLLLEEELGQRDAVEAAQGWGGDWYVAWNDGDDTCVRNTIVMDTPDDLKELASALEDWAAGQDDAEVDRGDAEVTFTACA